jgi:hypothetical protein
MIRIHPLLSNLLVIAEESESVHAAEQYLADFSDVWTLLPPDLQSSALRRALWSLTIVWLSNPLHAEIRLSAVARAASLPKSELRRQIKERAEFCTRFRELYQDHPQETIEVLCRAIL